MKYLRLVVFTILASNAMTYHATGKDLPDDYALDMISRSSSRQPNYVSNIVYDARRDGYWCVLAYYEDVDDRRSGRLNFDLNFIPNKNDETELPLSKVAGLKQVDISPHEFREVMLEDRVIALIYGVMNDNMFVYSFGSGITSIDLINVKNKVSFSSLRTEDEMSTDKTSIFDVSVTHDDGRSSAILLSGDNSEISLLDDEDRFAVDDANTLTHRVIHDLTQMTVSRSNKPRQSLCRFDGHEFVHYQYQAKDTSKSKAILPRGIARQIVYVDESSILVLTTKPKGLQDNIDPIVPGVYFCSLAQDGTEATTRIIHGLNAERIYDLKKVKEDCYISTSNGIYLLTSDLSVEMVADFQNIGLNREQIRMVTFSDNHTRFIVSYSPDEGSVAFMLCNLAISNDTGTK